jgi:diaminopimelate decarboxylase
VPPTADPNLVAALQELGCVDGTALTIGGLAAPALATRFGTPLYVFDGEVLRRRVAAVQAAVGPRVELLWSVKANPSLAVTACLRAAGTGAEVASLGELQLAIAAGHDATSLRFAGPGKTDAEIDTALALGLGCFHAESHGEVERVAAAARARGRRAAIALRVNLPQELGGSRLRMGGRSSRFGIDVEQVPALARRVAAEPSLQLAGLHVYAGTQCFDADAFVAHAQRLVELASEWERELGLRLDELDLGGGFGVPTYAGDPSFDLAAAGRGLQALVARHDRPGRRWFVELGRYLAAPAGVYLTRVVDTKQSGGERHVVLDGGMHQAAAAAGVGTVLRRSPLLVHAQRPFDRTREPATLGGPLCTPADQFAEQAALPPLVTGDLVAVLHAGAYGLSYSPHGFLSHATPAEILVEHGDARVVRQRGDPGDVLRGQQP